MIKDDMQEVLDKLLWADITIWSFPLYYFSVPGKLKTLMDRQLPMVLPFMERSAESGSHPTRYDMSSKRNVLISTCGFYTTEGNYDAATLYIFDSHSYSNIKGVKGYGWIENDQIEWYKKSSKAFTEKNQGKPLPSLAFFHIPIPEYTEAAADTGNFMVGTRKEKVCAPAINTGLGAAMLECGDMMGVFVGHDHVNDYATTWRGILLCYGRYTGGNTVYNNIPGGNGARIIELREGERAFKTWIRIKDGKIINMVDFPNDTK